MEIFIFLFLIILTAFDVILFVEIEHLVDNSLMIGKDVQKLQKVKTRGKK